MTLNIDNNGTNAPSTRCAAYLRYSSDSSNPTSIEDQLRNCEDFATDKNWTILPDYVRSDKGISGAALATRKSLQSLLEDAKRKSRPFDCVLIDDTSRLGRNLSDVLKVSDIFRFNGVFLYFVTQELDSRNKNYKKILIVNGAQDEDFLEGLRNKVHRGMKGKVLKGYHTGGTRYGYRRVLVEDPIRKDEHGRPAVDHSILEKDPNESEVVHRIFTERAGGSLLTGIARKLNAEHVNGPRGGTWCYTGVRDILRNELYRGIVKWNRTMNDTDPESGKKKTRDRPQKEWIVVNKPELAIVSDELWEKVQEIDRRMSRAGRSALGGLHRTPNSRTYLFSNLLKCGTCSERMNIVKSDSKGAWYGCRAHYYGRLCANGLLIERDRLEEQLLEAIALKLRSDVLEESIGRLREPIEKYLNRAASAADDSTSLEKRLTDLKSQQSNITRAIARCGDSEALLEELEAIESQLKDVKQQLARSNDSGARPISFQAFRDFVFRKASNLASVLGGDREMAKQALSQVIRQLILTPVPTEDGPALAVSGDIHLFGGSSGLMPSESVEHSAKHYAFPLTLTGLKLDPRRAVRVGASSNVGGDAVIVVPPMQTLSLDAATV